MLLRFGKATKILFFLQTLSEMSCQAEISPAYLAQGATLNNGGENGSSSSGQTGNSSSSQPDSAPVPLGTALSLAPWHLSTSSGVVADFAVWTNAHPAKVGLAKISSTATRAAIVFHDASRDAEGNAQSMLAALKKSASDPTLKDTLLLGPWFMASTDDWPKGSKPSKAVSWPGNEYMGGEAPAEAASLSSYAVVDAMLTRLADTVNFPNLKAVTLIGHSGGGQTTQLYSTAMSSKQRIGGLKKSYSLASVVANPSSYAYLDAMRPSGSTFGAAPVNSCPAVDRWKYGLERIPALVASESPTTLASAYTAYSVTYLLGLLDNDPNDSTMAQNCEAEAQGSTRLIRGRNFVNHLKALYPQTTQKLCEVPGIGHDTGAMLQSQCAADVLFRTVN